MNPSPYTKNYIRVVQVRMLPRKGRRRRCEPCSEYQYILGSLSKKQVAAIYCSNKLIGEMPIPDTNICSSRLIRIPGLEPGDAGVTPASYTNLCLSSTMRREIFSVSKL